MPTSVPHLETRVLFRSALALVRDVDCHAPRSPAGREEQADGHVVIFPRTGVFVRHPPARGRAHPVPLVADAAHAVLLDANEPYRVSHPADGGDRCTVLAVPPEVAREIAASHDSRAWDAVSPTFAATHALLPSAVRLRLGTLRAGLLAGTVSALAAEVTALDLLHGVLAARAGVAAMWRARTGSRADARRPTTRRARRVLAEAVKEALAIAPEASVPLAALARRVGASPYHLTRVFRAEVGVPVHQYQLGLRLAIAIERLVDEPGTLATLGLDLGFSSHGHFTRAFRRAYGMTPSVARAAMATRGARARPLRPVSR